MTPTLSTVREAQSILRSYLPVTRLVAAPSLSAKTGANVFLKLETDLPTGSFKPRGALYALSINLARRPIREVTASSTGNHGAAVAFAARQLGLAASIFLPENPNPVKRARIAALGANIVEKGAIDITEAFQLASAHSQRDGIYFLNDATDPDLPAGPATIALEIFAQQPETQTIVVPMGDTALIRGIAAAAKQLQKEVRIIGVQAERAPAYFLSWKRGQAISTETCDTIADGLATRTTEAENVNAIRHLVDDVALVTDDQMLAAIRHLAFEEHLIAEPAGAAATAALLQGVPAARGEFVVALLTGANIPHDVLHTAICGKS